MWEGDTKEHKYIEATCHTINFVVWRVLAVEFAVLDSIWHLVGGGPACRLF